MAAERILIVEDDPAVQTLLAKALTAKGYRITQATDGVSGLTALEQDHNYLLEGGVFTPDLIETWISWKRENELDPIRLRPTPHEFALYYDV